MNHASFVVVASILVHAACSAPDRAAVRARTAADVLASARRALGWDELARSGGAVRVVGSARVIGTDATRTIVFDGTGRSIDTNDGPLAQSSGDDGTTCWSRDWTGTPRTLVLGDLADAQISEALTTGSWTTAGAPLVFDARVEEFGDELVLSFAHVDGVVRGTIRLDATTYLARSAAYASDATPTTWTFGAYALHDGFAFPRSIDAGSEGGAQSFVVTRVERIARVDAREFAPRLAPPDDARFDASLAPELEVKRVKTGHVLVHPLVDGQDLGWFIFDSGAGTNCISNAVTEKLGTEPFGEIGARGIGGTVPARFWRARSLQLGPLTLDAPTFMGLDLAFLEPHFGVPVAGILGYELLTRCVAEVDMTVGAVSIHDPRSYVLPASGSWESALVYARHPCVRARFEQHEGIFRIDTGAAQDTVTFHYQAVVDLDLLRGRDVHDGNAGGVGGQVGTKVGKLASFRLGGREAGAVTASFTLDDKGAFSDDYVSGNVGGKLLEPFRLTFDYPNGRMGFVPR